MEKIKHWNTFTDFLTRNQYVVEPTFTLTTVNLREAFVLNQIPSDDITVMCVLISYPKQWTTTTDIFQYIKPKARKKLRKNKKTFFVFDASTEGFSTIHQEPYYMICCTTMQKYMELILKEFSFSAVI